MIHSVWPLTAINTVTDLSVFRNKLFLFLFLAVFSLSIATGFKAEASSIPCSKLLAPRSTDWAKTKTDAYFLQLARDQWQFYADTVNSTTNYLPPDNVRVDQGKHLVIDHRTSPTNIGLYMLSTVTSQKLGIIGKKEALTRLRQITQTIRRLPKYISIVRDKVGRTHPVEHLFNWYSIDGRPAEIGNGFISTVDNGNRG